MRGSTDGGMNIDRCYCFEVTFAELLGVAERSGAATIAALQEHREFGRRCRLCHPYVRRMLRTRCTAFDHIVTEEDDLDAAADSASTDERQLACEDEGGETSAAARGCAGRSLPDVP